MSVFAAGPLIADDEAGAMTTEKEDDIQMSTCDQISIVLLHCPGQLSCIDVLSY